jgi:CRP/FNR family transcriptional regulator
MTSMSANPRIAVSMPVGACVGDSTANLIEAWVQQRYRSGLDCPPASTTRTLRRGQYLYRPGDQLKHVYTIKRGTFKTYQTGADGRERINGFHSTGQLLGLDALADRRVRCGALALDTSVICQIQVHAILEDTGKSGPLWHQVLEEFDNEIARLENRLALCCLPAPQRLADFILSMANRSGEAYLPMTHREIGNFLRLVPETVSRLLTKFNQRGWLSMQGRDVVIRDRNAIEQAAAGSMAQ